MQDLSPLLQTLFAELVQQVNATTTKAGTVYTQSDRGAEYLYAKYSVGSTRRDKFIGRANDPIARERADQIRAEQKNARERRQIIRILRDNGVPAPSRALGRVLDAINDAGVFENAVLVGPAAYVCYSPILGTILPSSTPMTQDADPATATLAIAGDSETSAMIDLLRRADQSFQPLPALNSGDPSLSFRSGEGFAVKILTPQKQHLGTNPRRPSDLQAGATPLLPLDWLIEEPVSTVALFAAGIAVSVPQPAKYAVHKLIKAQKRGAHDRVRRGRDLLQAGALIEVLSATDRHALSGTLEEAFARGEQGWKQPALRSLQELGMELSSLL